MKRMVLTKSGAILALSLLVSGVQAYIIPVIPATEGSRTIIVNRIAPQENLLETKIDTLSSGVLTGLSTKIDIIDGNVDDIETSVGVGLGANVVTLSSGVGTGLSAKIDIIDGNVDDIEVLANRIDKNMKIPITASGTISTSGSYIFASNITGDFAITTSNVQIDLNEYTLTGEIAISTAGRVDIYNGTIVSDAGSPTIGIGDGADLVSIEDIVIINSGSAGASASILIDNVTSARCRVIVRDCWITNAVGGGDRIGISCESPTVTFLQVQHCTITNFTLGGLYSETSNTVVENCVFENCGGSAAAPAMWFPGTGSMNVIRNNLFRNCYSGITLAATQTYNFVFQNVITGCTSTTVGKAITNGSPFNQIYGNYAYNNANGLATDNYFGVPLPAVAVVAGSGMYENIALL